LGSRPKNSATAQRCELLDYCARRGWTNVKEYADKISGRSSRALDSTGLWATCERIDRFAHVARNHAVISQRFLGVNGEKAAIQPPKFGNGANYFGPIRGYQA
jgi:hypothetical protein